MRRAKHTAYPAAGLGIVAVAIGLWGVSRPAALEGNNRERALNTYANLPFAFVENRGQTDRRVRYYAHGSRYAFHFTRDAAVLSFVEASGGAHGVVLSLRFVGGNPKVTLEGQDRVPGEVNYFRGADPSRWRTALPRYAHVVYREQWPGIDMMLRGDGGTLKYEFRVRAGARIADIQLAYDGATRLTLDDAGALVIETALGVLRDSRPVTYQTIAGARIPVGSRYLLKDEQYGFALGATYDPSHDLVIDPGIAYTTFLGGSSHESANALAVDASGNVYVTGITQSPDFPTTAGAFDRTGAPSNDLEAFVTKLNPNGTALVYSTFLGGSNFEWGRAIAIDASGNAYIAGQTKSSDFPTTGGAFDRTFNVDTCPRCGIDQYDAFVAKLNASGSGLVYSTFLGGFDLDDALAITIDGSGNAYIGGETGSSNFPTTPGALDRTPNGSFDAFVTKLNATGSALVYSTYLGGLNVEFVTEAAVDGSGNAYMVGSTSSPDFPTTPGAFDTTQNGLFDVFVIKLNPAGSALLYSTFLGGQGFDDGGGLALDAAGNAYVSGGTGSTDFPTTPGAFNRFPDGSDAFVTKLNPAGSALAYSTVLGGTASDGATGVALNAAGEAWLTGSTSSVDFPVTAGAADSSFNGVADVFVSELSANGSALLYSTYLGGAQSESGNDVALDSGSGVYVAGHTYSMDFPATVGAFDTIFNGDTTIFWGDAFVTKIATNTDSSTPLAPPGVPPAPTLLSPFNGDTPPQPITFDWSETPNATSYTIQIDDSSAFSAPLVREQNVTTSGFVASGLATTPHFWRVRGVNSAGTAGAWSAVRSFTPQAPPPPATLSTLSTNPGTVVGGNDSFGTVVLSVTAPEGGALVTLSSSNPTITSVPAHVTVPAHEFTGSFVIATSPVSASTTITITASYNSTTRTATLTVTPPASEPPPASLQSLALNPTSVVGGSNSQGTVTLSGAAPQGGAAVSLSSSNPGAAGAPAGLTVPPGATSATFTVSTTGVSTSTTVTISATYNSTTRSANLTVTPPAPPPQTATLTVTATGRSGERVTSSPAGINVAVGSTGSASFNTGTSITLSVTNGRDAIWSGACSSGSNKTKTCTFTLTANAAVTANVQ